MLMIDRNSKEDARKLIEWRVQDSKVRFQYLSILADAIVKANSIDISQWVVTTKNNVPRLVVGHYYTYTLDDISKGVWLALDTESLETLRRRGALGALENAWKPDLPTEYPHYKDKSGTHNPFSTNGYYDLSVPDPSIWAIVEKLSFGFISKALDPDIGQSMRPSSRKAHASGVLKYMRSELGRQIPDPRQ
jgi:hypothetical protein